MVDDPKVAGRAGKPTSRFDVANLDQWGRLVKSWATDLDYVSQPWARQPPRTALVNETWPKQVGKPAPRTVTNKDAEGQPKPWCLPLPGKPDKVAIPCRGNETVDLPFAVAMTKDEFRNIVSEADVSITNIPKDVNNVIVVQGSPDTMVIRLPPKDMLQSTEDDLLNGTLYSLRPFYWALFGTAPRLPITQADIMQLHANRIGEYTLNNCGG